MRASAQKTRRQRRLCKILTRNRGRFRFLEFFCAVFPVLSLLLSLDVQVSALIHTANRDYKSLIEDLVALEVLPADTDRGQVRAIDNDENCRRFPPLKILT